jgi:putative CocE/NonD family hydrolase
VLTVGGWYDAEDPLGPLKTYRSIAKLSPANTNNGLVMGPWSHGGWLRYDGQKLGHIDFGAKTVEHFRKNVLVPFFEKHLKEKDTKLAAVHMFETGTNVWRQYPAWPPANVQPRTLHLRAGGKLAWTAEPSKGFDEYVSDPAKPVPYTNAISINVPQEYVVGDQRFVASRTDVLVYQSDVLEEDVTIAGPITPRLFVSTSGTDSDFVVKLIDVWPAELNADNAGVGVPQSAPPRDVPVPRMVMAGYQQLVRGEPFRAKFRKSFVTPTPMTPNKVEKIEYEMPDLLHTFRRGHRIMVQIQSSWFPLIDRNPQTFVRIPEAKASDYVKATQRVFRGGDEGSSIGLLVVPGPSK